MPSRTAWKERELEILRLLGDGLSDRGIAARLHLAPDTVRWYNKQIYERLGVTSRAHAVRRATALGLLDIVVPAAAARPSARSPIRYVSRGGVSVAYQVVGGGPVDLLFVHGFISHLELAWEEPEFGAFFDHLGRAARVILFDKRGVGLSDRTHGAPTLEESIGDACAVLDAVGSKRTFVMGPRREPRRPCCWHRCTPSACRARRPRLSARATSHSGRDRRASFSKALS